MTTGEIYNFLESKIPAELRLEWDNDGMMCCPDGDRKVTKVLVTLDITSDAVEYAARGGFDLVLSHHPLIFKKIGEVNGQNVVPAKLISLIRNNISAFSFHTRLDALVGGVNDCLCDALGIRERASFGEGGMGRIGYVGECDVISFAQKVKKALGSDGVLVADAKKKVSKVAVLGGEGGDFVRDALEAGADTFVSGRLGYHNMTDAPDMGINLIEAGHFFTEAPVCRFLASLVKEADEKIEIEIYDSDRIKLV